MKPCPTCSGRQLDDDSNIITCKTCGTSAYKNIWNMRPEEVKLSNVILELRSEITDLEYYKRLFQEVNKGGIMLRNEEDDKKDEYV